MLILEASVGICVCACECVLFSGLDVDMVKPQDSVCTVHIDAYDTNYCLN